MKSSGKPLLVFNNAYEFYNAIGSPDDTLDPKSEFSIRKIVGNGNVTGVESQVYRTEYFSFAFYKDAGGECSVDGKKFTIQSGMVIFNNPGHVKQYRLDYVKELCHMTLSESFLKENVHNQIFDEFPFLVSEIVPPKVLTPLEYAEFEERRYSKVRRCRLKKYPAGLDL
jgi:hypothetical protein